MATKSSRPQSSLLQRSRRFASASFTQTIAIIVISLWEKIWRRRKRRKKWSGAAEEEEETEVKEDQEEDGDKTYP